MTLGKQILTAGLVSLLSMAAIGITAIGSHESSSVRWIWFVLAAGVLSSGFATVFVWRGAAQVVAGASDELLECAESVSSTVSQISAATAVLAQGVSQQTASLADASKSVEKVAAMTKEQVDCSRNSMELADRVNQSVASANHSLEEMVESMRQFGESSEKVARIVKVIDEIAFQTNILALNAAVEAARAGDAGLGFAVVADEVRALAQRSVQAARDTTALIEESIARASSGSARLEQVASSIRSITDSTIQVRALLDQIRFGSQEQTAGVNRLAHAMLEMKEASEEAAERTGRGVAVSNQLASQADLLLQSATKLRVTTLGRDSQPGVAQPKA